MGNGERKAGDDHAECREQIGELKAALARLQRAFEKLRLENEELQARLKQNSRNSSRPPSGDFITGPKPNTLPRPPGGRKPGGQPGHEGQTRELLPADKVKLRVDHKPRRCRRCGRRLGGRDRSPLRHQVMEIPPIEPEVIEHRLHRLRCRGCGETTCAELPQDVPSGMLGPRLLAITAYLSGKDHLSKRSIQQTLGDLLGVPVSLGTIPAAEQKVSAAIAAPVKEAHQYVQEQPVVNADETSWRQRRKKAWLWVAVSTWVTVFMIHVRRGARGARALLGTFRGCLITDRWGGYNGWPLRMRQGCWAHLVRDFLGFLLRGKEAEILGRTLLWDAHLLFELWRRLKEGAIARSTLRQQMGPIRKLVYKHLKAGMRCRNGQVGGKCREILKMWPALWTFVRVQGVETTNNRAERAIRPAVLYRKGSFGTHSAAGSRFVERILTVVTTLRQQGRNVLEYLTAACAAAQTGRRAPSLLPSRALLRAAA